MSKALKTRLVAPVLLNRALFRLMIFSCRLTRSNAKDRVTACSCGELNSSGYPRGKTGCCLAASAGSGT
jgi:hypothetical protein